jgi:hypothetical protein
MVTALHTTVGLEQLVCATRNQVVDLLRQLEKWMAWRDITEIRAASKSRGFILHTRFSFVGNFDRFWFGLGQTVD